MSRSTLIRIGVVLVAILLIGLFFVFDLNRYLTLEYLKSSKSSFDALYADHPVALIAGYMIIYIVAIGLNLPGAVVLTLAGGAFFGFVTGTILVSFASSIGATIAAFVARFLLREPVEKKFGDKLQAFHDGVEKEGAFYLFTLRLIPIFPFFMINLVMGLTRMRLRTFYWVSQLGMLPGTMVYINAGKEIGKLDSLSGILSPSLLASFALLGIFPIAAKKIIGFVRSRSETGMPS